MRVCKCHEVVIVEAIKVTVDGRANRGSERANRGSERANEAVRVQIEIVRVLREAV
jgi:hypothetical protein